jgi:hypothetical protein
MVVPHHLLCDPRVLLLQFFAFPRVHILNLLESSQHTRDQGNTGILEFNEGTGFENVKN